MSREHRHLIVKLVLLAIVSLNAGCAGRSAPIPPEPLKRSFDSAVGRIELYVAPITFSAAIDPLLYTKLCYWAIPQPSNESAYSRAKRGVHDCNGKRLCYLVPEHDTTPELTQELVAGPDLPGYSSQELSAQLLSALSGIENLSLTSVANSDAAYRMHSPSTTSRAYLLRGSLTEMKVAQKVSSGIGGSGLGLGLITFWASSQSTEKIGYVRIDLELVDLSSGRIIMASPAGGTFSDSYTSETFFQGVIFETEEFQSKLIQWATREAFNNGAALVWDFLRKVPA